jgi:hypothetical protein
MRMKKVAFTGKPPATPTPANADAWVSAREALDQEATKRFTIDVPLSLHRRVKSQCAQQDLVMADVVRELLEERFPARHTTNGEGEGSREHD